MIDDYDVDAVNNTKRSLEKSANSTAIKQSTSSSSASSSAPPPPIPNRSQRSGQSGIISPRSKKEEPAKVEESVVSPKSPKKEQSAVVSQDKKAHYKEKLATLKSLYDDELITKEEYDKRRNALVDELMNS